MVTTNRIILAGEVRGPASVIPSLEEKVRAAVKDIGYEQEGFHWKNADYPASCTHNRPTSPWASTRPLTRTRGAGDQGIMFGYATNETPELMPATLQYSHNILKRLAEVRHSGEQPGLEPDAKSQVTLLYENGKPVRATSIVLSTQHKEGLTPADIDDIVRPYILKVLPESFVTAETEWHINPTGNFVIGGPDGDCGLTGRKIIVDTYGGAAPHGGGAFSGKDRPRSTVRPPTPAGISPRMSWRRPRRPLHDPDRLRHRRLQAAVLLRGPARFGPRRRRQAGKAAARADRGRQPARPARAPAAQPAIYARTAAYGHFGREPEADGGFSWEKTDLVDALKGAF